MKSAATAVLGALYHQLGPAVKNLVEASEINEILRKSILKSLEKEEYEIMK